MSTTEAARHEDRPRRSRSLVLVLALTATIAWILVPPPANWVESVYSRGVFRVAAAILVPLVDTVGVSLTAMVGIFALILLVTGLGPRCRHLRARGIGPWGILRHWARTALWCAVILHGAFVLSWGANYRRERLADLLSLEVRRPERAEVERWTGALARIVEDSLPAPGPRPRDAAFASLRESLGQVFEDFQGFRPRLPRRVKVLPAGFLITLNSSGFTSFILEPHVDGALPEWKALAVGLHELAHSGGLATEADADLAAALAGLRAEEPYARYAMALHLWSDFARELGPDSSAKRRATLPPAARRDVEELHEAYREARYPLPWVGQIQRVVYDSYLRSQGMREGIREYGFVVKNLLAAEAKGLVELPRAP